MRVRIKYFAKYADLAGTRQEEFEVGHIKIGELLRVVKENSHRSPSSMEL